MTNKLKKHLETVCYEFKPNKHTPMLKQLLENYKSKSLSKEDRETIERLEFALLQNKDK